MSSSIGVYLHVPFCEGKCPYCDFYSRRGSEAEYDRFAEAMTDAIKTAPLPPETRVDTIYFGGGTPSLLGAARLVALLHAVRERFGGGQLEVTLEANPRSVDSVGLDFRALLVGGFTRVSFGVQSLCEPTLQTLGRRHTAVRALEAIREAAAAGFSHLSADLMLAVPGQTIEEIEHSIELLSREPIDHLSAYLLKLEPGTAFASRFDEPDEDFAADCYLAMARKCEECGFAQYEISNFARSPAAQSLHNLHYWRCEEYLGIGPAAHSFAGGRRFYFPRDLDAFLFAPDCWGLPVDDGPGGDEEERMMLGLRLNEGIDPGTFSQERRAGMLAAVPRLQAAGLVQCNGEKIALTIEGFLVSNTVIAALLGF